MNTNLQKKIDFIFDKRFCEFALTSLGKQMNIKLVDGKRAEGLFYTAHPFTGSIIAKNYSKIEENEREINKEEESHLLETDDFVYFSIENLEKPPIIEDLSQFIKPKHAEKHAKNQKKVKEMKTDAEISNKRGTNKKDLVKWEIGDNAKMEVVFDENSHKMDSWNQFAANKEQFGIDFHFKEEEYTTKLDISKVDHNLKKKAERIEREMLNDEGFDNRHILEERGKIELSEEIDEESKFAAVMGSGRYQDTSLETRKTLDAKEVDLKFKSGGPLRFINKNKDKPQGENNESNSSGSPSKNDKEKIKEKDEKKNENKQDIIVEKNEKIEKTQEKKEVKTLNLASELSKSIKSQQNSEKVSENTDENFQKQDYEPKNTSEINETMNSLSLKNKKFADKSLKLNSVSFFALNKPGSNKSIPEFKPQTVPTTNENTTDIPNIIKENQPTISKELIKEVVKEAPKEVVKEITKEVAKEVMKEVKDGAKEENNNQSQEKSCVNLTQVKNQPEKNDQFKLVAGDAHLSIKFKCRNISQDVNHNSKRNFKNVCLENWEKVKDRYNLLTNDTSWKKIKLESKDSQTKSIVAEPKINPITSPTPSFQSTLQTPAFYPTNNVMYPPMGINPAVAPGNYNYPSNIYAPVQNYGYNMGYDYGYQGNSYMNPMMGQNQMNNMKYYGVGDPRGANFPGKK